VLCSFVKISASQCWRNDGWAAGLGRDVWQRDRAGTRGYQVRRCLVAVMEGIGLSARPVPRSVRRGRQEMATAQGNATPAVRFKAAVCVQSDALEKILRTAICCKVEHLWIRM